METDRPKTLVYQRAQFATRLPVDYLFSPAHEWLARQPDGCWRLGLTKFATRLLGEPVDHAFQVAVGTPVSPGQIVGWIEGFKAISDLHSIAEGKFAGANPRLDEEIHLVNEDPYGAGWLYLVEGVPAADCVDVYGYCQILDRTIERLQQRRPEDEVAG